MKVGDHVRFLSDTGGGVIAGFQKGNIVLVEDEDGFQIPTPANEVVVVQQDDYSMGKMISEKIDEQEKAAEHAQTELKDNSRSVKAILADGMDDLEEDEPEDPSQREITYQRPAEERKGGNKLSAYLAFVPEDAKDITNTDLKVYFINDSNYYLQYACALPEGNSWNLKSQGEVEPNTKVLLEKIPHSAVNTLTKVAFQLFAYKRDKAFVLKPAVDVVLRIEPVKFYKLHTFTENLFFDDPAMLLTIVENDETEKPLDLDPKKLKKELYKEAARKVRADEIPSKGDALSKKIRTKDDGTIVVDLHASSLLETTAGMNSADILHYQVDYFKSVMEANKKKHGQQIVFIHGKGEGVLRQAVIHELNYRYKNCRYQDASFQEYGYGATLVTIK